MRGLLKAWAVLPLAAAFVVPAVENNQVWEDESPVTGTQKPLT
jgi:hypothetical protein